MTIQNMTIFITDALENQALANELVSVVGDKEGAAANQAVAELAQSKGYDVTIEDAAALSESALTAGTDGELSDADLDGVSGGLGGLSRKWDRQWHPATDLQSARHSASAQPG